MVEQTTPETQTCPFCYTELDSRATVCSHCQAVKDITPMWMVRLKFYGIGLGLLLGGLFFAFVDGRGVNWLAVVFAIIGAVFLVMRPKFDLTNPLWRRKE